MKKKVIIFIIIIAGLSLLGIVFTQQFWIRNAVQLQKEQFDHRVSIALKSVVSNLMIYENNHKESIPDSCSFESNNRHDYIKKIIRTKRLDSLLYEEFSYLNVCSSFKYGVYKREDKSFLIGADSEYKDDILRSSHSTSLSCLYKHDCYVLSVYFPDESKIYYKQLYLWLVLSGIFLIILVFCFSYIVLTLIRQKKLSEMKTDFVNNMTHELKTPISTISLASEMLLRKSVHESIDKTKKYASVIFDENNRLKNQVEQVLQIAVLDKGEFKIKKVPVDINETIDFICDNFEMQVRQRDGNLTKKLGAEKSIIMVDQMHFSNLIANLLDNANKYSPTKPTIIISTRNHLKGVLISVEDNGIGISSENQKHVFKQFYRVHTGNIHNVKGFGLGLYYVRTIVEAHDGYVKLVSEIKKGSRFEIYFPYE